MSLFQKSVFKKYLKELNSQWVEQAWEKYTAHFHNPSIQENIRNSKEEQYQGGFLIDLFVNVLGYVKNPTPNFNLTTELKNLKGAKKTDGAILQEDKAIAVIELKGTNTIDLAKVETQAFGYKNNQPDCIYVITSNFEKLRFYIDNAVDYEEFNLFQLSKTDFEMLYLCLAAENLLKGIPKQIKNESLIQEKSITKKLYKDYSQFRNEIFDSIQKNNLDYDKLTLFKKTQKLLDRFLFIFFAEDRLLLPPNSIREIVSQWTDLRDKYDEYQPLYDRFKKYFGYMNTGYCGQKHDIFAYNGGLFEPDEILDNIKIDDQLLYKHTLNLSNYDFESEVSVNILGHIFEHSLTEIENIQAQLEGTKIDKNKTKRKKDGVFYTPKYITKYIVDTTVGKLCEEKKTELGLQESNYKKERKGRKKATLTALKNTLDSYRQWLLQLTICDPACGSGAFLNQALEFLIVEHRYIDELKAQLLGDTIIFSEVQNAILENNLFGVDINEESVEIAKLSLWLHTAQKGRKLTTLNDNIKCGNSLIDDPEVAGDKAFNWQQEFPRIFDQKDKQGFHIVLTTHNSRTSQRMTKCKVKKGTPLELNLKQEIALTEIIGKIIQEKGYNCLAYNVCKDHVHMILVCEYGELTEIVQRIKSSSSKQIKPHLSMEHAPLENKIKPHLPMEHVPLENKIKPHLPMEHVPLENKIKPHLPMEHVPLENRVPSENTHRKGEKTYTPFWSQKFFRADLDVWQLATLSHKPGYMYGDNHLNNALTYIYNNRVKHQLPTSKNLQKIIDSFVVDQDQAFHTEYKGGFDVVIGNPPYVQSHSISEIEKDFIYHNYKTAEYQINTCGIFVEQFIRLLKPQSYYSLIIPNYWLSTKFDKLLRKEVFISNYALEVINTYEIFESATVDTLILTGQKIISKKKNTSFLSIAKSLKTIDERLNAINLRIWDYSAQKQFSDGEEELFINFNKALNLNGEYTLRDFLVFKKGMQPYEKGKGTPPQTREMMNEKVYHSDIKIDDTYLPLLGARHIKRNYLVPFDKYIKYGKNLAAPRNPKIFTGQRILINRILSKKKIDGTLATETYINNTDVFNLLPLANNAISIKVLYALIVSRLCATHLKRANVNLNRNTFPKINVNTLETFPVPSIESKKQERIDGFVDRMLSLNSQLHQKITKFLNRVQDNLGLEKVSKKMATFYNHDFKTFLAELKNTTLSLVQQDEWEEYFTAYKTEIKHLQTEIEKTDREIDQMVYALYGLTENEIEIVENT